MSFGQRLQGLETGKYDVIAYGILVTSEIKDSLLLTSHHSKQTGVSST